MKNYFNTAKHGIVFSLAFFLTLGVFYLVYAATYSLPARVGTGSGLSSGEWNKMVDSIEFLKGEVDSVKTNIASLQSKNLKTFIGATAIAYDGAGVGGYAGGDTKCVTQFGAGARMCTSGDFANGTPNTSGWINTFLFSYTPTSPIYITDCNGWASSLSTVYGVIYMNIKPRVNTCSASMPILCCK